MGNYVTPLIGALAQVASIYGSESMTFHRRADPSASVTLTCLYPYHEQVIADLLSPNPWPGNTQLYVDSVSVGGMGKYLGTGQTIEYQMARLDVAYTPKPSGEYTENISNIVNVNSLPAHIFRWENGMMLAQGEEPGRQSFMQKITHAYDMIQVVTQDFVAKLGHVNEDVITTSQGIVCQPETLLYMGCESSISYDRFGTMGWQITTSFMFNPATWNKWWNFYERKYMAIKIWNPKGGMGTDEGKGGLEDFKMYPETELRSIFEFAPSIQ